VAKNLEGLQEKYFEDLEKQRKKNEN